jgi:hypothetical protein
LASLLGWVSLISFEDLGWGKWSIDSMGNVRTPELLLQHPCGCSTCPGNLHLDLFRMIACLLFIVTEKIVWIRAWWELFNKKPAGEGIWTLEWLEIF